MKRFRSLRKPLLFALAVLPVAAVAGYFTIVYQLDILDAATIDLAVSQIGSQEMLMLISVIQTIGYAGFCGFFGYLLAEKLGLMKPFRFEKRKIVTTIAVSVVGGALFSLDYWTFGAWIPGVREAHAATLNWKVVTASVLYGGVVEELMLRLFFMSLIAWLLWKVFYRRYDRVPTGILIAANVIAAVIFAAGHLPATVMTFGTLTPMLLLRCFLLNGGFGLLFGWLYRKYGIQYSMVSHALFHIISKLIWFVFI